METHMQHYPVHLLPPDRDFSAGASRLLLFLIVLMGILPLVAVAQAQEPAWNYSSPDTEIGGVAVSPKGDLIAVGAGKVLFFAKNGTLVDKEPFGNDVMMTPDGKYTVSAYSSTIYFFKNSLPSGPAGPQGATKQGEYGLPQPVSSFDVSRDGSVIAGQTVGKSLFTITTKTGLVDGNTKQIDSVITISPAGRIIGISPTALHSYSSGGTLTRSISLTANSAPRFLLIPSNGNSAIFNDGQAIRQVNTGNGTERWKRQVTGSVTALSMTPDGSLILAGTETGNLAALDGNGNVSWTYPANPENRQGTGITCSALSDKGSLLAAGTVDGRILFLNSRGNLTGSSSTREYIRYIAMSTDGSVVVAASDSRVYTFFPGSSPPSRYLHQPRLPAARSSPRPPPFPREQLPRPGRQRSRQPLPNSPPPIRSSGPRPGPLRPS